MDQNDINTLCWLKHLKVQIAFVFVVILHIKKKTKIKKTNNIENIIHFYTID